MIYGLDYICMGFRLSYRGDRFMAIGYAGHTHTLIHWLPEVGEAAGDRSARGQSRLQQPYFNPLTFFRNLKANPYPEVTDLFCRLPLFTLFYQPEAVFLWHKSVLGGRCMVC